jgi:hypothetical protein
MPSASLMLWQGSRLPCLVELEAQAAATAALAPPNPRLAEENLRGWVVLMSAHFQGFCRDLHTEVAVALSARVRKSLAVMVQRSFTTNTALARGNPTLANLKSDFDRYGLALDLAAADPANHVRLRRLGQLNVCRNIAAHQAPVPPPGLPTVAEVRDWQAACDGLTMSLDRVVYNHLRKLLRRAPWPP